MKEYQKRVIEERSELKVKYNKLGNFLEQGKSPTLTKGDESPVDHYERSLMEEQYRVMGMYITVLSGRIALFK